ncbi:hypothetical protein RF11_08834 [Thelohanellus kitauei]|uniref:DRBM domain-containing protein n=1 Tax=Thelohanellus kitauei TaxID=669202 RepID=A0A0C2MBL3_THEKT|nr:hypothetical protein RF11_08834 [Thelohanellus kitauei]
MPNTDTKDIISLVFEEAERVGSVVSEKYTFDQQDNQNIIKCKLTVKDFEAIGIGTSKISAKRDACYQVIDKLKSVKKFKVSGINLEDLKDNPCRILSYLASQSKKPSPVYTFEEKDSQIHTTVSFSGLSKTAVHSSKKQSKNLAAKRLLDALGVFGDDQ